MFIESFIEISTSFSFKRYFFPGIPWQKYFFKVAIYTCLYATRTKLTTSWQKSARYWNPMFRVKRARGNTITLWPRYTRHTYGPLLVFGYVDLYDPKSTTAVLVNVRHFYLGRVSCDVFRNDSLKFLETSLWKSRFVLCKINKRNVRDNWRKKKTFSLLSIP